MVARPEVMSSGRGARAPNIPVNRTCLRHAGYFRRQGAHVKSFVNLEKLRELELCDWAGSIGLPESSAQTRGSIEDMAANFDDDPDEFLASPYQDPYEALCVADHEQAKRIAEGEYKPIISEIAKRAYLKTWDHIPDPEICGLVSDDAHTFSTLLLANSELSPFAIERLNWYLAGRVPFGYIGGYPDGKWLIL